MNKDQRRAAIKDMFKRKGQPGQQQHGEQEMNEVQQISKQLEDCKLPEET